MLNPGVRDPDGGVSTYWTIFAIQANLVADSCDPDLVLIDGTSLGRGTPGETGQAEGEVETATGPFAEVEPGARMFWRGKVVDDAGTQFEATLHIH
jgi:hypothetical protein